MGKLMELLRTPATHSQEALEDMLAKLAEMDALLDEVAFLRVQNAELKALVERYEGDDGK